MGRAGDGPAGVEGGDKLADVGRQGVEQGVVDWEGLRREVQLDERVLVRVLDGARGGEPLAADQGSQVDAEARALPDKRAAGVLNWVRKMAVSEADVPAIDGEAEAERIVFSGGRTTRAARSIHPSG